jgi:hypothetical protein
MSAVPYRSTFARLLTYLRPYRRGVAISIVLAVGSQAAQIALIWVTGKNVIDQALLHHDTHQLWLFVGAIAVLGFISAALMLGRRLISGKQASTSRWTCARASTRTSCASPSASTTGTRPGS